MNEASTMVVFGLIAALGLAVVSPAKAAGHLVPPSPQTTNASEGPVLVQHTPVTKLAHVPVEQQVRELIFQLRNQTGWQSMIPGRCNVFDDPQRSTNTPAHQLLRLGYAAVPQLIDALTNTTPSRARGMRGPALSIGDCAEAILERIAARDFLRGNLATQMTDSGAQAATRKAVETWWAEARVKGEKQMLMEAVLSPDREAPAQAELLCQRYPEIAVPTLIRGAQVATEPWVHARLVEQLARFDTPQVTDFLEREMSSAPSLEDRARAAEKLRHLGKPGVVQAIIHEWESLPDGELLDGRALVPFLAHCDSVAAVQALARNLRQRPASARFLIIRTVGETNSWDGPESSATAQSVEECLVAGLEDTEEQAGMFTLRGPRVVYDPRSCDVAGYYLAKRWPARYVFTLAPSLSARERQRLECLNVWRRGHSLPPLPLPAPATGQVKPEQATLVTNIKWVPGSSEPSTHFAAKVDKFRGRPLKAEELVAFLDAFGANPEPHTSGLELKALKDENLTGVELKLRLLPGTPPDPQGVWGFSKRVVIGGTTVHRSGGNDIIGEYSKAGSSVNFTESVAKALAADPKIPFEIWFQIQSGRGQ